MDEEEKIKRYEIIQDEMHKTFIAKDKDYGSSFDDTMDMFGMTAALTRIFDKFNRLKTLYNSSEQLVNDESMTDTLLDMANYAILTAIWLHKDSSIDFNKIDENGHKTHRWDTREITRAIKDPHARFKLDDGSIVHLEQTGEYLDYCDGQMMMKNAIMTLFFDRLLREKDMKQMELDLKVKKQKEDETL